MLTPYVAHTFGDAVARKLEERSGWLTAGVASSINWPSYDVCIGYGGDDFILRGSERDGKPSPPCISISCARSDVDAHLEKIYKLTAVLSWFLGGYVDVSTTAWGNSAILVGNPRTIYSTLGIMGRKSFNCNHMPIIENDSTRQALAFWREGNRLREVHSGYSFLSFYKVIESQFNKATNKAKVAWIEANIVKLSGEASRRVAELKGNGIDVNKHLFESGRCAVAHASLQGSIVDPDIPDDRRRLAADLVVIEELARNYIRDELKIPDVQSLYRTRDRTAPWKVLIAEPAWDSLKRGEVPQGDTGLDGLTVGVGIWPDGTIEGLEKLVLHVDHIESEIVKLGALNSQKTILLVFFLDVRNGRVHTNLEDGGLIYGGEAPTESDVKAYATFFYKVLGNGIAEISCGTCEPIDCEVVIPVNIIPPNPEEAIAEAVERFRRENAKT